MADPTTLDDTARTFEAEAERLTILARRAAQRVDASTWTCARADRTRGDARGLEVEALQIAADLRVLAGDLRTVASRRRAEIEVARTLEARVRAALAGSTGPSPLAGTSWTESSLPPSGDVRWRVVADDLGVG